MKHLLDIQSIEVDDIHQILSRAKDFKDALASGRSCEDILSGKVIINMFFENSTRTLTSFQMAAYRLGAQVINWQASSSSTKKGETFSDTMECVAGYHPDAIVVRHEEFKAPYTVKKIVDCPVINAGDSWRAHPSQALLDVFTMQESLGDIAGKTIAICGDVAHSRVASSNVEILGKLGARVHIVAPDSLLPNMSKHTHVETFNSLEDGLVGCDVVMMLRNQKERMEAADVPDDVEYFHAFGLTQEHLARANEDAFVMHPGPMNRNVEIADDVVDDPVKSKIFEQMANGLPVRMAIFEWALK